MKILPAFAFALALTLAANSPAQSLLFDFGTTPATGTVVVSAAGANATYYGGPAGLTGNLTYNVISGTDPTNNTTTTPSPYRFSDNSTATNISLSLFTGTAYASMNSTGAPFPRTGFNGSRSGVGVFQTPGGGTSLWADLIGATNTSAQTNDFLGTSIAGMAAGQYTVYMIVNNTFNSANGTLSYDLRIGQGAAGVTNFSNFTNTTITGNYANIASQTASWSAAENVHWASFNINLSANNTLYLGSYRSASGTLGQNQMGLFNGIQIVAVPEPAVASLAALGIALLLRRRRR